MAKKNFKIREACEICNKVDNVTLLEINYQDHILSQFLSNYYSHNFDMKLLDGMTYRILKCKNCGFIWQNEVLTDEINLELYSHWGDPKKGMNKILNNKSYMENLFFDSIILKSFFPNTSNHKIKILDYGAGWGFYCNLLKGLNFDVYALELSEIRIKFMKNKLNLKVLSYDKLNEHKFDFINAYQVFEHIENPKNTLQMLNDILKKEGIIHLSVPNGRKIEGRILKNKFGIGKNQLHPLEHINCFTPKTLINLGKILNLEKVSPNLSFNMLVKFPISFIKILLYRFFYGFRSSISIYFQKRL